jgi:hypothetical protein
LLNEVDAPMGSRSLTSLVVFASTIEMPLFDAARRFFGVLSFFTFRAFVFFFAFFVFFVFFVVLASFLASEELFC